MSKIYFRVDIINFKHVVRKKDFVRAFEKNKNIINKSSEKCHIIAMGSTKHGVDNFIHKNLNQSRGKATTHGRTISLFKNIFAISEDIYRGPTAKIFEVIRW